MTHIFCSEKFAFANTKGAAEDAASDCHLLKLAASAMKAKPDMVVNKQMKDLCKPRAHGHVPGTAPGDVFHGKGELAITGIHKNISGGIDCV